MDHMIADFHSVILIFFLQIRRSVAALVLLSYEFRHLAGPLNPSEVRTMLQEFRIEKWGVCGLNFFQLLVCNLILVVEVCDGRVKHRYREDIALLLRSGPRSFFSQRRHITTNLVSLIISISVRSVKI